MKPPRFDLPLLSSWDRLPVEQQRDHQDRQLRYFVRNQLIHSPFYRKLFDRAGLDMRAFRGLDDLEKIPLSTKADLIPLEEGEGSPKDVILQPTPENFRLASLSERLKVGFKALTQGRESLKQSLGFEYRPITVTFTTGRSSEPTPFFYSLYDMEVQAQIGNRLMQVVEARPGDDMAINLFPYAPHLAFWQTFMASLGSGLFMFNTGGGRIMGTEKILGVIEKMKASILVGIPGYFYHLLRSAEAQGYRYTNVRRVVLGGEQVTPLMRERIVEILGRMGSEDVKVCSILGFTESRQSWGECPSPQGSGFHTYPDLSLLEIIDPETGKVLPEGQTGEMVYTTLVGRGSCLLRYRTGDIVQGGITHQPCSFCGRILPRLGTDIRRVSNHKDFNLSKVKGTLVDFNVMSTVLSNLKGIEEWQVIIHKLNDDPLEVDQITVVLALEKDAQEAQIKEKLNRELQSQCEVTPNHIKVESLEAVLKRIGMEDKMKEERIVDQR